MNQGFRTHPHTQPNTRTPGTHPRSGSWDRATGVAQKKRTEGPPPPCPLSLCEFGHRDSDTGVAYSMKSGGPPPHVAVAGRPPRQRRDGKMEGHEFRMPKGARDSECRTKQSGRIRSVVSREREGVYGITRSNGGRGRAPIVEPAARRRIAARRRRHRNHRVAHPAEPHRRAREHNIPVEICKFWRLQARNRRSLRCPKTRPR